jgi:hypothetical protein
MVLVGVWERPALAEVSEVTGSAYGFFTSVSLFDGPAVESGPLPVVTLPPEGSATPITEADPDGESAQYGPAIIVQATAMTVSTEGTIGPQGSVTSSASAEFDEDQEEQDDPFNVGDLESTCTASESGPSGSTTLNSGSLVTSTDPDTGKPIETIDLPVDPAPNTTYGGTIDHVGDTFRIVLNEQIVEGDTLTVNAVHFYLGENEQGEPVEGVARGEAIIGQSVCGVTAVGPGESNATSNAESPETAAGSPESTTDAGEATSTTQPAEMATTGLEDGGGGGRTLLIGALVGIGLLALIFRPRRPRGGHFK